MIYTVSEILIDTVRVYVHVEEDGENRLKPFVTLTHESFANLLNLNKDTLKNRVGTLPEHMLMIMYAESIDYSQSTLELIKSSYNK